MTPWVIILIVKFQNEDVHAHDILGIKYFSILLNLAMNITHD